MANAEPGDRPRWRPATPLGAAPRSTRRLRTVAVGGAALLMTACVVFLVVASVPDPVALGLSLVAAVVPAVAYSLLVLRLDRYEREPRRALLAAFGWGAIGAVLFSVVASLLFQAILVSAVAAESGEFLAVAVGAPVIEETFKGLALVAILLFFRRELDNVLDGLVYGALIGLGFAMTENVLYFGSAYLADGIAGLGRLFVARAVIDGFGHAAYTATTGAAIGWARRQYRRGFRRFLVPVLGWELAVLQHFLWNAGLFVIGALQGQDASIFSVVLVEAPLFVLPAVIVLVVIARIAGRRELVILREQLGDEVERGVLGPAEYHVLTDDARRRCALAAAKRHRDPSVEDRLRRFYQLAAELAFRKHHLSRGERPMPGQRAPEDAYRQELAVIRAELGPSGVIPAPRLE